MKSFAIIPAIDLKDGHVVRLMQGDMNRLTQYSADPPTIAREFESNGATMIHVVDLDGAVAGEPRNLGAVGAIVGAVSCAIDVSGGLRTIESIDQVLAAGAERAALGSAAFLNTGLLFEACRRFPGRIFGSLDVRDGRLAIKGWIETSTLGMDDASKLFRDAGVVAIIHTDIVRDGTTAGVDVRKHAELAQKFGIPVIASGGIATLSDITKLRECLADGVVGVIIGRALYENRFTLAQAIDAAS